MSLPEAVHICLTRQRATFVAVVVGVMAAVAAITFLLPKEYQATATLAAGENRPSVQGESSQADEQLARTYGELLKKSDITRAAAEAMPFETSRREIDDAVTVEVVSATPLIDITAAAADPERARVIATTYARTFVRTERAKVRASAAEALDALSTRTRRLVVRINELEGDGSTPAQARLEQARNELEAVRSAYKGIEESLALRSTNVSVASEPNTPTSPSRPRPKLYLLIGALVAVVLGIGAAFLRDAFDKRVRGEDEISEIVGAPILARIPEGTGSGASARIAGESLSLLRSNLQLQDPRGERRFIAVTSALPDDGKTFLTGRLAASLGLGGARVVAVDCDLREPELHAELGAENAAGLSNVLVGARTTAEVIADVGFPNVRLVPGGPTPPNPAVLLASERSRALFDELRDETDFVLADTPPITVGADATAVAALADAVLLVVDPRHVRADVLRDARDQLARSGTEIAGVVINRGQVRGGEYRRYHAPRARGEARSGSEWLRTGS